MGTELPQIVEESPISAASSERRSAAAGIGAVVAAAAWALTRPQAAVPGLLLPFASASSASTFGWTQQLGLPLVASAALAGLAAGCLHTLAGPDHLAALAPLTVGRAPGASALCGALWGLGHSAGQLALGLGMVLLKGRFERLVPALTRWSTASVGAMLLLIGGLGLKEVLELRRGGAEQPDAHAPAQASSLLGTFATGVVYGLQPDSLFVIVPALTLSSQAAGAAYMTAFVVGTVVAMGGYAGCIGIMTRRLAKGDKVTGGRLSAIASLVAVAVGLSILVPALADVFVASA